MTIAENTLNLTGLISTLPPGIIEKIGWLTIILKTAGIAIVIYICYIITMGFVNFRRAKRIKYITKKVDSIDKKLNALLKNRKKHK